MPPWDLENSELYLWAPLLLFLGQNAEEISRNYEGNREEYEERSPSKRREMRVVKSGVGLGIIQSPSSYI